MKLYTEEQVKRMLEVCRDSDLYEHILTFEDILKTETPIVLPSDDEIENYARPHGLVHPFVSKGARWVIDKIQGGNK